MRKVSSVLSLKVSNEKIILLWLSTLPIEIKMDMARVILLKAEEKKFIVWRRIRKSGLGKFRFF